MHHIPLCIQGLATENKKANEMSFSYTQDGIGTSVGSYLLHIFQLI